MSWYKVAMPMTDWEPNKKGQTLIETFLAVLVSHGGDPRDAAMFSQKSADRSSVSFYFSPSAAKIAKVLMVASGAEPCQAPDREGLILAAGDQRAFDLLWPPRRSN
jgi:hypothetical protein